MAQIPRATRSQASSCTTRRPGLSQPRAPGRTTLLSHGKRARFGQDPGRRGSRRWQQHQQPSRECGTLRPGQRNVLGHGLDGDSARRAHGGCAPVGQGASSGRIRRKRRARERGAVRSARRWRELHRGWRMSIVRVQRRYLLRGRMRRCVHDLRGRYWRMHDCDQCRRSGYVHGSAHLRRDRRVQEEGRPHLRDGGRVRERFCADGYCCDTACSGACDTCDATPGTCTPMAGGTACGTATCTNDAAQSTACDGQGTCVANAAVPCAPYTCGGTACKTGCTDSPDCASGYICTGGACVLPSLDAGTDSGGAGATGAGGSTDAGMDAGPDVGGAAGTGGSAGGSAGASGASGTGGSTTGSGGTSGSSGSSGSAGSVQRRRARSSDRLVERERRMRLPECAGAS